MTGWRVTTSPYTTLISIFNSPLLIVLFGPRPLQQRIQIFKFAFCKISPKKLRIDPFKRNFFSLLSYNTTSNLLLQYVLYKIEVYNILDQNQLLCSTCKIYSSWITRLNHFNWEQIMLWAINDQFLTGFGGVYCCYLVLIYFSLDAHLIIWSKLYYFLTLIFVIYNLSKICLVVVTSCKTASSIKICYIKNTPLKTCLRDCFFQWQVEASTIYHVRPAVRSTTSLNEVIVESIYFDNSFESGLLQILSITFLSYLT